MHPESMTLMTYFRDKYVTNGMSVLDIGSRKAKRHHQTYRELFTNYTGMDVVKGRNVDIVGYDNLGVYDVVISGQVMEHIEQPWKWLKLLANHYTQYICIIAPWKGREHRYPIDTYRYMPDGMRALFQYAGIREIEIIKSRIDTIGIGGK